MKLNKIPLDELEMSDWHDPFVWKHLNNESGHQCHHEPYPEHYLADLIGRESRYLNQGERAVLLASILAMDNHAKSLQTITGQDWDSTCRNIASLQAKGWGFVNHTQKNHNFTIALQTEGRKAWIGFA